MTSPRSILITGASGLIGTALGHKLSSLGDRVITLSRAPTKIAIGRFHWDPRRKLVDHEFHKIESIDAVVHLAGESIADRRWTATVKESLWSSRIDSARFLIDLLAQRSQRPLLFLSASAVGIYGDRGDEELSETSRTGSGFLSDLARAWEQAASQASNLGSNVTTLRFGVVLDKNGGALAKMLTPFRFGLGGVLGSGRQYMSWIGLEDAVNAILFLLEKPLAGAVNITAPEPVTNREFTNALGQALGRPTILSVPAFGLRMLLGDMADEMLLSSQRVLPKVLASLGFVFRHPRVSACLTEAVK